MVTPAPGLQGGGQGIGDAAPATPALPVPPAKRHLSNEEDEREAKRQDTTESPKKSTGKRDAEIEIEEAEKKMRSEETDEVITVEDEKMPEEKGSESKVRPADHEAEGSPGGKMARLYPPHYAGIQSIEVHGDEEVNVEYVPEETNEELQYSYGGEEDGDPPEVSQEELDALDKEASQKETERMLSIPAMEESNIEEVNANAGYVISTRMVYSMGM